MKLRPDSPVRRESLGQWCLTSHRPYVPGYTFDACKPCLSEAFQASFSRRNSGSRARTRRPSRDSAAVRPRNLSCRRVFIGMMRRAAPLKRVVIPVVIAGMAGIALTLPVQASAPRSIPGRPDPRFGKNGRVVHGEAPYVKREESNRSTRNRFAVTPGGKIVVESGLTLSRYLSDGRPDAALATTDTSASSLPPKRGSNRLVWRLTLRGRVLVAGITFAAQQKMFCFTPVQLYLYQR